ncbi:MAG: hypothetical protein ABIF40_04665 [archaeon]
MKKLMILLLLLPLVHAEELFSGSITDGEFFDVNGVNCRTVYSQTNEKLLFEYGNERRIIDLSECAEIDQTNICFDDVDYPSISVSLFSLSPDITVERTFTDTTFNLGDTIEVEAIITNDGDKTASNVVYVDTFPDELMLLSGSNNGNSVRWEGKLTKSNSEIIKYKIKAVGITTYDSIAQLSYDFNGKTHKLISEDTLEVKKPFRFISRISSESPNKGQRIVYNVTLENTGDTKLTIQNLLIEPSKNVEILEYSPTLKSNDGILSYSGTLSEYEEKVFPVQFRSVRVGEYSITASVKLKSNTIVFDDEIITEFGIGVSKIYSVLNISPKIVSSGDDIKIQAILKNTGNEHISGINAVVQSEFFDDLEALNKKVNQGKTEIILQKNLVAPEIEKESSYNVQLIGSYKDADKRTFTFKDEGEVLIKPLPKIIKPFYEFDKKEYNFGDEVKVDVYVINLLNSDLNDINLVEMLPNKIKSSLKGTITDDITLGSNEKKKAYSYSFIIPLDYDESSITLKSNINVNNGGKLYIYELDEEINITQPETIVEHDEPKTVINDSVGIIEENIDESEDPGFLRKIANFFRNFFKK